MTGARVEYPIRKGRVGSAIWVEREIIDMLIGWELLAKDKTPDPKTGKVKESSWLHFDPALLAEINRHTGVELPDKVNGENQAYDLLETEAMKPVVPWLFDYFRRLNGGVEDESPKVEAAA